MIEINKDNFDQEVLQSDKPVIVDFWGPKCGPCLALLPKVEELAKEYEGKVKFCKVDTSANRRLAISQNVMGLPTVILYKDGQKVKELVRDVTADDIKKMIQENI
ncbi:MAG TPA: thioredoxin [Thermoanaerobacterales bacterium]|nr:thioredoxin [Thermoanaerobacterales bacterium]